MNDFISILNQPSACDLLQFLIGLPVIAGILLFIIPEKYLTAKGIIALIISLLCGYLAVLLFASTIQTTTVGEDIRKGCLSLFGTGFVNDATRYAIFTLDNLSRLLILFSALFVIIINIYSLVYLKSRKVSGFYSWLLITSGCTSGALLSDNLLLFLTFWGILGITLYKLIPGDDEESSAASKKTLIMIGASDSVMIIGIAIIWRLTGTLNMSAISLSADDAVSVSALIALLAGSFTKAGAFPLHTWIPDYSQNSPATSSALLPASLDKLLGIYFLARITNNLFVLNNTLSLFLLAIGGITIIAAVMMALVQHDYRKLLGFHAVSQVGYMIMGFGLGSPIGVAAGLFHMINHTAYKSGLFLSAGCIEYRTGKYNIDDLGGLSKAMPFTFIASLIFAMSISGVPPFNGFASKWMIYQGIIEFGTGSGIVNKLWILWLGLAVAGSALTLASFIKLIGGIFLSRAKPELGSVREVSVLMWFPLAVLALICISFGVFASNYVVPKLFMPVSGEFHFTGFWNSSSVSFLVLISLVLGIAIYLLTTKIKFRSEDSFIGGEKIQEETGYPTPEFYKTISELGFFSWMYKKAEKKWFDIYDLSKQAVLKFSHILSGAHSGILPEYLIWACAGLIIMLLIMI